MDLSHRTLISSFSRKVLTPVELAMRNGVTHEHPRWRKSRHAGARLWTVWDHWPGSMFNVALNCLFAFSHSRLVSILAFLRPALYLELWSTMEGLCKV